MLGMEMMFSNLIGMKPEELKAAAEKTLATIEQAGRDMAECKARLAAIEEMMNEQLNKGIENVGRNNSNSNRKSGRGAGSGSSRIAPVEL